ncbi:uncharacterized protein LOC107036712 [Diachasma alloeum]|uniref:uncharacterized protein LOC107036712 n=1 Tax=Diachasma alloeum TaxID=454923 RepID=UPI0007384873|nr:uncharacterized protein LOC107036712 [Diachasma alloeum]
MNTVYAVILFLSSFSAIMCVNECVNNTEIQRVVRETAGVKRYLVFPQGSNVQLVYCLTVGTYAKPTGFFTMGITAGLAYELPYTNTVPHRRPAEVYHRRSRRDLYKKVELMLNTRGKDGRACVLKALCLSGQRNDTQVGKGSFMEEMMHSVFTLPGGAYEADPMTHYERAHEDMEDCQLKYSSCPEFF